jgi:hypothetical protein
MEGESVIDKLNLIVQYVKKSQNVNLEHSPYLKKPILIQSSQLSSDGGPKIQIFFFSVICNLELRSPFL